MCRWLAQWSVQVDQPGSSLTSKKEPLLKKSYFQLRTLDGPSKEFTRRAYQLLSANSSDLTLIHYEKATVHFPLETRSRTINMGIHEHAPLFFSN